MGHKSKGKKRGSVTYGTDRENEVSKIFVISLVCVTDSGKISIVKNGSLFYLFDLHARNCLGMPDELGTAVVLQFSELDDLNDHKETSGCSSSRMFFISLLITWAFRRNRPSRNFGFFFCVQRGKSPSSRQRAYAKLSACMHIP